MIVGKDVTCAVPDHAGTQCCRHDLLLPLSVLTVSTLSEASGAIVIVCRRANLNGHDRRVDLLVYLLKIVLQAGDIGWRLWVRQDRRGLELVC